MNKGSYRYEHFTLLTQHAYEHCMGHSYHTEQHALTVSLT